MTLSITLEPRSSGLNRVRLIYKSILKSFEILLPHYGLECHWRNSRSNMSGEYLAKYLRYTQNLSMSEIACVC
jgi:hypothetical protein